MSSRCSQCEDFRKVYERRSCNHGREEAEYCRGCNYLYFKLRKVHNVTWKCGSCNKNCKLSFDSVEELHGYPFTYYETNDCPIYSSDRANWEKVK